MLRTLFYIRRKRKKNPNLIDVIYPAYYRRGTCHTFKLAKWKDDVPIGVKKKKTNTFLNNRREREKK